jgi:hypothetical protein
MRLAVMKKGTAVLFEKLMAILNCRIQRSSPRTRSDGLRDVAARAVSYAYCTSSTCREGVRMSLTYSLKSAGETSPTWAKPARMPRHVDVADWKDVWNVRQ